MWRTGASLVKYALLRKISPDKKKSPLQIYNSGAPFERLQMDILDLFPASTAKNKYLLVIMIVSLNGWRRFL